MGRPGEAQCVPFFALPAAMLATLPICFSFFFLPQRCHLLLPLARATMEVLRDVLKQDTPPPAPQTWVCSPTTVPPPPTFLAYSPSYELYEYQKQSASLLEGILHRQERWNILCASPTGSGKSFLIKYAAKVCESDGLKLIVGVPLVALAIQHYEDLCSLFDPTTDVLFMGGDEDVDDFETYVPPPQRRTVPTVGVWTGPVQINELDALICVCTYEVLQIQLDTNPAFFDGAPLLVLDEIHTMGEQQVENQWPRLLPLLHQVTLPSHFQVVINLNGQLLVENVLCLLLDQLHLVKYL